MKTTINQFGEEVTKWENSIHPDNPNFQQIVFWFVWVKPDGRVTVGYHLGIGSKTKFIFGLTKEQAINKYYFNL